MNLLLNSIKFIILISYHDQTLINYYYFLIIKKKHENVRFQVPGINVCLSYRKFSFDFKKTKSERKAKHSLLRLKLSMFFLFQFFWALNMFCRFWTRVLDFQGLESRLVQNSCKRQPFSNYIIITSKESKSYKRRKHRLLLLIKFILKSLLYTTINLTNFNHCVIFFKKIPKIRLRLRLLIDYKRID